MLLAHSPTPFSREQFTPGHVTTSGMVIHPDGDRALILHHRRLGRWLLPGGHVEPSDPSIQAASAREVLEETGVVVTDGQLGGADVLPGFSVQVGELFEMPKRPGNKKDQKQNGPQPEKKNGRRKG